MINRTLILPKIQKTGSWEMIETESALCRVAEILARETCLAVDLEADSMFHFKEKVCLVQVATTACSFVIDPLKIGGMMPLKPIFAEPAIKKIFHGADFDVRSLYRDFGIEINNLFDTELASRFLGVRESGLGAVLRDRFDIQLDKRYQRKNWSRRPLSEEMLKYAASDVIYLHDLASLLEKELKRKRRDSWVAEECELLSKVRYIQTDKEPLFMKFKGAGRLDPRSLAVLEGLLAFRVAVAREKDKPLFKVFSNSSMMALAVRQPSSLEQLRKLKVFSARQITVYGARFIDIIRQALALPKKNLPHYPRIRKPKLDPGTSSRVNVLKLWRNLCAEKLNLEPSLLFSKAHLTAIAMENPEDEAALEAVDGLKNWQRAEFGTAVINVLTQAK